MKPMEMLSSDTSDKFSDKAVIDGHNQMNDSFQH
jgi:hypothetical protein